MLAGTAPLPAIPRLVAATDRTEVLLFGCSGLSLRRASSVLPHADLSGRPADCVLPPACETFLQRPAERAVRGRVPLLPSALSYLSVLRSGVFCIPNRRAAIERRIRQRS